ncbi:MAG: glycosyltransferase family 4 protein [Candidatus Goldbacteria bacterium]|nr:glycosyltransferase family 4 protein [Candidatus Goldiibacteriota bacterium]
MKITFVSNNKRINGPEIWRKYLMEELSRRHSVKLISSYNPFIILREIINSDVIHTYNNGVLTIISLIVAKFLRKRIIHTIHGDYYTEQKNKKGIKKIFWLPFSKLCNFFAEKITFVSKFLYKKIIVKEPYIKDKSFIIYNGIDISQIKKKKSLNKKMLGLKKSDKLLIQIGNFNIIQKTKSLDFLIKDFNKINKKKNFYLFILGEGKYWKDYKKKYETANIKFIGFKNNAISYIKASDIFVHYSLLDTFPMPIIEALACNKPIIAWGCPVFKEILGYTNRIFKILDENYLIKIKRIGRKLMQKYSLKRISQQFEYLYKK